MASFVESIEDARQTELQRLGSSKLLVALTGADLEPGTVLRAVGSRARSARGTFAGWAADEEPGGARALFEGAATLQAEAVERVGEPVGDEPDSGGMNGDAVREALGGLSGTVERAGGLVGWALVTDRLYAQVVGFFVNRAATARADLFRELRDGVESVRVDAIDLLTALPGDGDDRERAGEAAESVVRAAYDDYAATLDGMGLDPKPVC